MRVWFYMPMLVVFVCMQTGCWDAKEIQSVTYASAIGIDYEDHEYVAYLQIVDFSNVARTESGLSTGASVWVGRGKGLSPHDAVDDIYRSSQHLIFWGNITAIVFSERALKRGIDEVLDLTNRYREIRYTKWVYGTSVPMEHLLSVTPFFKQTPLASILHEPEDAYRQASYLQSIRMNAFIAEFHEPMTTLVPRLSTTNKTWVENEKPKEMLYINGAYIINKQTYVGLLSHADLIGTRWMNPQSVRNPLAIMSGNKPSATLIATKPQHTIKWVQHSGKLKFNVTIEVKVTVNELMQVMNIVELEKAASNQIEKEIRKSYAKGLKLGSDPLRLGYELYKKKPAIWHKYWDNDEFPLDETSLQKVNVVVSVQNSGKYKLKQ